MASQLAPSTFLLQKPQHF